MKSIKNIRVAIVAITSILFAQTGFSQITKSDYFMESSYLRNSMNPALRPNQGYLVVPALPNVGANVETNKLNLDNLTFKGSEGKRVTFMHQSVGVDQFMNKLSDNNHLNADVNVKLFGYGFFKDDQFWNIDLGVRTQSDINIPKPFFGLLKRGFEQDKQSVYDLSNLSATGNSFIEVGVSHSRLFLDNNLSLGARVKLLGGLADFNLNAKKLNIEAGPDFWLAKSQVTFKGSAPGIDPTYDDDGFIDGADFGNFTISGYGVGLDIGAVYEMKHLLPTLSGLKVSAAFNDIGFIAWGKKNSVSMRSSGDDVIVEQPTDYYSKENGSSLSDVFEDAFDDIKKAVNLQEDGPRKSRTTALRMNMNLGAEYEIYKNKLSVGALYSSRFGNYFTTSELTVSANGRLASWVSTSVSYSFLHSAFNTFGFALHLAPAKGVNLFLASDFIIPHVSSDFIPTTSKALNFQMGISIPLGKRQN